MRLTAIPAVVSDHCEVPIREIKILIYDICVKDSWPGPVCSTILGYLLNDLQNSEGRNCTGTLRGGGGGVVHQIDFYETEELLLWDIFNLSTSTGKPLDLRHRSNYLASIR